MTNFIRVNLLGKQSGCLGRKPLRIPSCWTVGGSGLCQTGGWCRGPRPAALHSPQPSGVRPSSLVLRRPGGNGKRENGAGRRALAFQCMQIAFFFLSSSRVVGACGVLVLSNHGSNFASPDGCVWFSRCVLRRAFASGEVK